MFQFGQRLGVLLRVLLMEVLSNTGGLWPNRGKMVVVTLMMILAQVILIFGIISDSIKKMD